MCVQTVMRQVSFAGLSALSLFIEQAVSQEADRSRGKF